MTPTEKARLDEECRQATYTYPACPTPKCKGKIRTIHQTATEARPAMCVDCLLKHEG